MSQVEAGIVSYTLSSDYYARVGADFDTEAVDDAILAELNGMLPSGSSSNATVASSPTRRRRSRRGRSTGLPS